SRLRRARRAAWHAGNLARQLRPARHLDARSRRHPDQEGDTDAACRPQYFRRGADRWGVISQALPAAELESTVTGIARELGTRHLGPLEHSKITVQMGRDLSVSQAIQLDQLVSARMRRYVDPTE